MRPDLLPSNTSDDLAAQAAAEAAELGDADLFEVEVEDTFLSDELLQERADTDMECDNE